MLTILTDQKQDDTFITAINCMKNIFKIFHLTYCDDIFTSVSFMCSRLFHVLPTRAHM